MMQPRTLADVPVDFENVEYRWRIAPPPPRRLGLLLRASTLPAIGPRFISSVIRRFTYSEEAYMIPGFRCLYGNLILGTRVHLADAFCVDYAPIVLYDGALLSWKNMLITSTHDLEEIDSIIARPIVLEKNVWITSGCIVLGGVRIGENTVVAAGSVVSRSLPPNVLAGGNPAKPIKDIVRKAHQELPGNIPSYGRHQST